MIIIKCACGCGQEVTSRPYYYKDKMTHPKYVRGHNSREVRLCACGCGRTFIAHPRSKKKFLGWHGGAKFSLNPEIGLTSEQKELILGGLLGDLSCLSDCEKTAYIQVSHSLKQHDYCEWKAELLSNCLTESGFRIMEKSCGFLTKASPTFQYYRELFYDENGEKRVTAEILEQLTPFAIAIWYMDDGCFHRDIEYFDLRRGKKYKTCKVTLHTDAFSLQENNLIKDYLWEKWQIKGFIRRYKSKGHYNYYLTIHERESIRNLFLRVSPYIIPSMEYKIGEIPKIKKERTSVKHCLRCGIALNKENTSPSCWKFSIYKCKECVNFERRERYKLYRR